VQSTIEGLFDGSRHFQAIGYLFDYAFGNTAQEMPRSKESQLPSTLSSGFCPLSRRVQQSRDLFGHWPTALPVHSTGELVSQASRQHGHRYLVQASLCYERYESNHRVRSAHESRRGRSHLFICGLPPANRCQCPGQRVIKH
jgi:hypothetical protein